MTYQDNCTLPFDVPQVREGGFYPQAMEKGLRSEQALNMALAEMYVQGTSTQKVSAIVEKMCGAGVSSSLVSKATAELDPLLEKWRQRPKSVMISLSFEVPALHLGLRPVGADQYRQEHDDGAHNVLGINIEVQ